MGGLAQPDWSPCSGGKILTIVHHLVHAVLLDELPVLGGEEAPPLAHLQDDLLEVN